MPEPVVLAVVLEKCTKEANIEDDDQPVYVCVEEELLKCKWCAGFKGSQEARVINQHIKSFKSHLHERQRRLHLNELSDPLQDVRDIRTYFNS